MGGGGTKIVVNDYNCLSDRNIRIKREPYKFNNLKHVRCLFFTQDSYNANYHIPKSTLTLTFNTFISELENQIEDKIKETYDRINSIARRPNGEDIKKIFGNIEHNFRI